MARPRRQEQRRAELVEAARQIVVEQGVLALRLTDVAKRAGLAPASVLYYFSALTELLREVQDQAVERFCAARAEAGRGETDPRRRLAAMIRSGLPSGPGDELCRLLYELGTVARQDPAYAARYIDLCQRQVALYTGILEAGAALGHFELADDPTTIARNLVVLEDGYGLHMTMAVPTFDVATATRQLFSYAATTTGCDLLATTGGTGGADR
ncbi:MAG TPA: TetR family transcriptional regulator C-terminal domain-containing protein [Pseudonocardia sp.]|jgi:AcrR family transcriptional regulator|nr:TetR family transcriptional regulator C-terminal domain-containing protein [Pseudonocardia sp.]